MDHNKINYDLIVAVLEWIVGKEHEVISLHCLCITSEKYKTFKISSSSHWLFSLDKKTLSRSTSWKSNSKLVTLLWCGAGLR